MAAALCSCNFRIICHDLFLMVLGLKPRSRRSLYTRIAGRSRPCESPARARCCSHPSASSHLRRHPADRMDSSPSLPVSTSLRERADRCRISPINSIPEPLGRARSTPTYFFFIRRAPLWRRREEMRVSVRATFLRHRPPDDHIHAVGRR
jgi:hypothetical protein